MYEHILLPTDGSHHAEQAAAEAIRLALALGARVTALHVAPEIPAIELEAWARKDALFAEHLQKSFEKQAQNYLRAVKDVAIKAGIPCECHYAWAADPAAEIVVAAHKHGCDLIFMGSHGKGESADPLLGSVSAKVVALSDVPVLMHRLTPSKATVAEPAVA